MQVGQLKPEPYSVLVVCEQASSLPNSATDTLHAPCCLLVAIHVAGRYPRPTAGARRLAHSSISASARRGGSGNGRTILGKDECNDWHL